jgi:peptidoglycan/xylan/chitin deacetylase (PgdA/CDA1 family)
VAVSAAARDHYVRNHWVPANKVDVIYSPLSSQALTAAADPDALQELREQLQLQDAYPVLLNVARLHPVKDQSLLVECMPKVLERWPKARLLIAGDGEMQPELEALIASRQVGGAVTLLGKRDDVPLLLAASDIFVLSSLSEGLGLSVIEAMAAGKPVVAARVGGIPEVVRDGVTGLLVSSRDPVDYAKAVERIAQDRDNAKAMGAAGRDVAKTKFHPTTAASRLGGVYRRVVRARRHRTAGASRRDALTPRDVLARGLWVLRGSRLSQRLRQEQIRILTYHGFTDEPEDSLAGRFHLHVDVFRSQLRHLKRHYNVVPLADVADHLTGAKPLPSDAAVITIDDGYSSAHALALPILAEFQTPATLFPALDFVDGKSLMWTDRVKACVAVADAGTVLNIPSRDGPLTLDLGGGDKRITARRIVNLLLWKERGEREDVLKRVEDAVGARLPREALAAFQPMTWSGVEEMVRSGLVDVGSHTVSHAMLTTLSDQELATELNVSKHALESRLGVRCDLFCYPYGGQGAFDDRAAEAVRAAGYRCALTTLPGMVSRGDDPFRLRRLGPAEDPLEFDFAMSGFGSMLSESKQRLARRLAVGHAAS